MLQPSRGNGFRELEESEVLLLSFEHDVVVEVGGRVEEGEEVLRVDPVVVLPRFWSGTVHDAFTGAVSSADDVPVGDTLT